MICSTTQRRRAPCSRGSLVRYVAASLALLGLLAPLASLAQPVNEERRATARALFEAGRGAFEAGNYERALDYFERTYALTPAPELLYNIGQAAERAQRDERALTAFEEYLARVPNAEERAAIEARIAVLRAAIAERGATSDPPSPTDPAPALSIDPPPTDADRATGASVVRVSRGSEPPIGGWVTAAGGGALALAGAVLFGVAVSRADEVRDAAPGTPWVDLRGAHVDADALGIAGGVLVGIGAAAAVAGIVWVIVGSSEGSPEVALGPGCVAVRGAL